MSSCCVYRSLPRCASTGTTTGTSRGGGKYSSTLAKLRLAPKELTDAQLVEFSAHASSLFYELTLRRLLLEQGIFEGDWKEWLIPETCETPGNPVGRRWLAFQAGNPDDDVREKLKRRLNECEPTLLQTIRSEREEVRARRASGKRPAPASERPAQGGDGDPAARRRPDDGSTAME
jgi:hypothetical protein